jgi:hypothetical protein
MSIIGILSTTSSLRIAKLTGTRERPVLEKINDLLKFPAALVAGECDEGLLLHEMGKLVIALLHEQQPNGIMLLKVVGSQHNAPSELRVKVEGLLQMLGSRLSIPTKVIAPVGLRNQEKKFDIFTGRTPEDLFCQGKKFKSVDLRTAVLTAWSGLPSLG